MPALHILRLVVCNALVRSFGYAQDDKKRSDLSSTIAQDDKKTVGFVGWVSAT